MSKILSLRLSIHILIRQAVLNLIWVTLIWLVFLTNITYNLQEITYSTNYRIIRYQFSSFFRAHSFAKCTCSLTNIIA